MQTKDETMPKGKWEFDASVTDVFDDMLARSIPQYEVMRDAVTSLALRHAKPDSTLVDIGCSRGAAIAPLIDSEIGDKCWFIGLEVSEPMLEAAKRRFADKGDRVSIRHWDLRTGYPPIGNTSVVMAILTLQFVPIEHRLKLVRNIYKSMPDKAVLLVVEKVLGATAELNDLLTDEYYKLKAGHGYTQEQIDRKRLSLEGVLVPMTPEWNEQMFRMAGFTEVDCFWRWMNFGGWICLKGE